MNRSWFWIAALAAVLTVPSLVQAHFIYIVSGVQSPDGKVHVYFSEATEPDNPMFLKRIEKAQLFQFTPGKVEALPLTMGKDSLEATPTGTGPKAFLMNTIYGAMTRGDASFLLNYYAKSYDSDQPLVWTAVADPQVLPLEIVPRIDGRETVLTVTWQGQPLAESEVVIGAKEFETIKGTTDKNGTFSAMLPVGKLYSIRAKHTEEKAGEYEGTKYTSTRHYSTLALQLPHKLSQGDLPPLEPTVTSFGGAILGDDVYVYGGHAGTAHHYSQEGQSGRFVRLNLKQPQKWEVLSENVPRRAGVAMVPYNGKLIRIGGFEALNKEGEKESLQSTADVAQYDPATKTWTDLTALPQGRSSHDAAVIGDHLYVVGGWAMVPEQETVWHKTALVADLTQSPLVWKELPTPPFQRRAVSAAAWKGQLVVIGGMQEQGRPTRATAIYNPANQTWSEGPEVQGNAMDGFGSSAFAIGDTLYISTMSGKLQRLSQDGKQWDTIAQLGHPRFFHRMLPTADGRLLFVGGASMQSGKIAEVEIINPVELMTTAGR